MAIKQMDNFFLIKSKRGYPGMSLDSTKFLFLCNHYHYCVRTSVQNQNHGAFHSQTTDSDLE